MLYRGTSVLNRNNISFQLMRPPMSLLGLPHKHAPLISEQFFSLYLEYNIGYALVWLVWNCSLCYDTITEYKEKTRGHLLVLLFVQVYSVTIFFVHFWINCVLETRGRK